MVYQYRSRFYRWYHWENPERSLGFVRQQVEPLREIVVRIIDRPDITSAVYRGCKTRIKIFDNSYMIMRPASAYANTVVSVHMSLHFRTSTFSQDRGVFINTHMFNDVLFDHFRVRSAIKKMRTYISSPEPKLIQ